MAYTPIIAGFLARSGGGGAPVTPGGADGSIQYNNAGAFGGVTGLTTVAGVLSGVAIVAPANTVAESVSGYSVTAAGTTSMVSRSGTLNTSGAPQIETNDIINTASASSAFGDGTNFFRYRSGAAGTTYQGALGIDGRFFARLGFFVLPTIGGNRSASITDSGGVGQFFLNASGTFIWSSGADAGSGGDITLTRAAAGVMGVNSIAGSVQVLSGAGAVDIITLTTRYESTGGAQALTLANGVAGQLKSIVHEIDGGSGVLTPTTKTGFTTITFTNVGDSCLLQYFATRGWMILSLNGAVAA